jgi:LysM repeat protein
MIGGRMPLRTRILAAAAAIAVLGFLAACQVEPAASSDVAEPGPDTPQQASVAKSEAQRIVVQAGQSLSRIAAAHGVSQRAIIAANDLTPPYKIKIGQQLLIPDTDAPPPAPAVADSVPSETLPADHPAALPTSIAQSPTPANAIPPPAPAVAEPAPSVAIPVDRLALPTSTAQPPTAATASPPPSVAAPPEPVAAASPGGDRRAEPSAPAVPVPVSPGSAGLTAPATTGASMAPSAIPAAAPPGINCPAGTIGMWSDQDVIKKPVYICHNRQSQG